MHTTKKARPLGITAAAMRALCDRSRDMSTRVYTLEHITAAVTIATVYTYRRDVELVRASIDDACRWSVCRLLAIMALYAPVGSAEATACRAAALDVERTR